jgi:PKD repeat protein
MAAPHVAGAAALLASQPSYQGSPAKIQQAIQTSGNFDWTDDTDRDPVFKEPLLEVTSFTPMTTIPPVNQPPQASFTRSCSGAACNFMSTSTDPDGTISSWSWAFGDGTSGSGRTVAHTYSASGKYKVMLTVMDNRGATSIASQSVSCQKQKGTLSCK